MSTHHNIIHFDRNRTSNTTTQAITLPPLIISAQRTIKHQLRRLLSDFFTRIDDSLFELADKAENNQQQTNYFDAMREIRRQKEAMETTYFEALSHSFETALSQISTHTMPQTRTIPSLDQISLLEDEQLEESLAISSMASSAESHFKEALSGITARLDFLINDIEITKNNNPLRPEVLFQAITPALKYIDTEIKVRLIIYKFFDKFVAQNVGIIYDTINADLIAAGVLPRLKSSPCKIENTSATHRENATEQTIATGVGLTQPEKDIFSSLQQLLSMSRATPVMDTTMNEVIDEEYGADHDTAANDSSGATYATASYAPQQILNALSQLQNSDDTLLQTFQQHEPSGANVTKAALLQTIKQTIEQTIEKTINQQTNIDERLHINQTDADAINIVSLLFDFILDDPGLPDSLKAQIARLQIPLLKVAILDKTFFSKKSHPARQLLNELAYASSSLNKGNTESDTVLPMVSDVVNTILTEFEENTEIFSALRDEFVTFIEAERESNKRACQLLEGAKDLVANEIQRRVTDNHVPPLVSTLLIDAWKDVLTHLYLRDGNEGAAWNTALQVADDLIWSVQPKLVVSERQRLIKIIPRILNGLRDGLTLIQFDREATEKLFAGLETLHLASLRGGLNTETPNNNQQVCTTHLNEDDFGTDMSSLPESTEMTISDEDNIIEEVTLDSIQTPLGEDDALNASQYAEAIKEMALGTWVEFTDAETQLQRRGKLAWKCDFSGEYTFVDRTYQVVADLSNRKLIEAFELGHAQFVDDVPLFDRALDSVIGGIKRALDNTVENNASPTAH